MTLNTDLLHAYYGGLENCLNFGPKILHFCKHEKGFEVTYDPLINLILNRKVNRRHRVDK